VRPVGSVSTTVTVPLVADPPELLGTIVYAPGTATVKLPLCDFVMASVAGAGKIVVGSLAVAVFVAPPPEAVAVFVTSPATVALTVMVMLAPTACDAIASGDVQVTVCPEAAHVQSVPVAVVNVNPAGSVSTTVIVPEVGTPPVLATDTV
jgi:hypothetical protein